MPESLPKMRRQKASNGAHDRALVELNGHRHYLGRYGTPEAEEAYYRLITEWMARGRCPAPPANDATILECADVYLAHLTEYYKDSPGSLERAKYALAILLRLYGRTRADEFSAVHLRAVREEMINDKLARKTVNERIRIVVAMFKYCASFDIISAEVYHKVSTLEPLKRGRSAAKETEPVKAPPREHVEAVKERVNRSVRAMIDLQMTCSP